MASIIQYDTPAAVTITLDGLASSNAGGARRSAAISNSAGWQDFEVQVTLVAASSINELSTAVVYLYCSADNGATWESGGNTNADVVLTGSERCLGSVNLVGGGTVSKVFRVSDSGRGEGTIPRDFGIIVTQNSGENLGTGCSVTARGTREQTA